MEDGTVIVSSGPLLMSILASDQGRPKVEWAKEGALRALKNLKQLALHRSLITHYLTESYIAENVSLEALPSIVKMMVISALAYQDPTITPLICVAGAGSDEVADFLFADGQTSKVIVNNGGDIAVRLREKETARIGLKSDVSAKGVSHVLLVDSKSGIGGVATSGFGGGVSPGELPMPPSPWPGMLPWPMWRPR